MNMTEEAYVSFETAKLLKEKGFDGRCYKVWEKHYGSEPTILAAPVFVEGETTVDRESVDSAAKYMMNIYSLHNRVDGYLAPTQQMAMRWLREEHKIDICIEPHVYNAVEQKTSSYVFVFWTDDNLNEPWTWKEDVEYQKDYPTYEEACEAAIKYCLENLI